MEKKYVKNQAGKFNNKVTLTISALAVAMFVCLAVQPALADPPAIQTQLEEVIEPKKTAPDVVTCKSATASAIEFMINHVKTG